MLRDCWWPHPVHGAISFERTAQLFVFTCVCGEQLGVPLFVARDVGLID